jgi:hypothetical protein
LVILGILQEKKAKVIKNSQKLKEIEDKIRIALKEKKEQLFNVRDLVLEYDITNQEAETILKDASRKYYGQMDVDEKGIVFVKFE